MPIVGLVEGLEGSTVRGWALSNEPTCQINVADGEGRIVATGIAAKPRQAADRPPYRIGFRIETGVPAASRSLRVFAGGHELAGSPLTLGPGLFDGGLEVRDGRISGWVQERVAAHRPAPVCIHDQYGQLLATVEPEAAAMHGHGPYTFGCDIPPALHGWQEIGLRASCNGVTFAKASCSLPVEGCLDALQPGQIVGWAMIPGMPDRKLKLEVCVNGQMVKTVTCNLLRAELRSRFPLAEEKAFRCGFSVTWADRTESISANTLSLRICESGLEIFAGPYVTADVPWAVKTLRKAGQLVATSRNMSDLERTFIQRHLSSVAAECRSTGGSMAFKARCPPAGTPRLSIIIPVYRDVETTRACIRSVLAHRRAETDTVIIVNDRSPDMAMAAMLEGCFGRAPNLWVLTNPVNRGFVGAVNRGLAMARRGDVLLLNSDTEIYAGGIDELVACAHVSDDVGTVTPLSNNATIFTYPHPAQPAPVLADVAWSDIAALQLLQPRELIDVPTGHGFCLYVRREALEQVGVLDEIFGRGYGEENDLCQRIADLGYRNVAASTVFVRHLESVSFGDEKDALRAKNLAILSERYPEYQALIDRWIAEDPLRAVRWAADRRRLANASARGRHFVISVENGLTGGTVQAIDDIEMNVGYGGREIVRLRPEGRLVRLTCAGLQLTSVYRQDEAVALFETLSCLRPDLYAVHQLLGYSEAMIRELTKAAENTPAIFFAHDFYAACPRTTMIDAAGRFCGGPSNRCNPCLTAGGSHLTSLLSLPADEHRRLMTTFLQVCARIVAPSRDAAARLADALPGLPVAAIPHPENVPTEFARRPLKRNQNHVVLLGALGPHKGSRVLYDVARLAQVDLPEMRFHVIGYTDIDERLGELPNVIIHGRYESAELPELLRQVNAASALFLHQWPETYSYTFSEAVAHDLVPVFPALGAIAERAKELGVGREVSFPVDPAEVLQALEHVAEGITKAALARAKTISQAATKTLGDVLGELGLRELQDAEDTKVVA